MEELHLDELLEAMPGWTPEFGAACAQAAAVTLERAGHGSGVELEITGAFSLIIKLNWSTPDLRARRCWADDEEAGEYGAYAIAAILMKHLSNLHIGVRARKTTGVDFWLAKPDQMPGDAAAARLEVSHIFRGTSAALMRRVRVKLEQMKPSDHLCPGYAAVIEYGRPTAAIAKKP